MSPQEVSGAAVAGQRLSKGVVERDGRLRRAVVCYAGSLAIHALFIFLLVFTIVRVERVEIVETPVEVVVVEPPAETQVQQPPPPPAPPQTPASPQAPAPPTEAKSSRNGPPSLPDVSDRERKQKAKLGEFNSDGAGTLETHTAAPSSGDQKQEEEALDPDPRKEISHLVPRAAKTVSSKKPKPALPGPSGVASRQKPDETATDDETTIKRTEIHCGANAKIQTPAAPQVKTALVLGELSAAQASAIHDKMQVARDLAVHPRYLALRAVAIRIDGAWAQQSVVTFLPPGVSAGIGDRVEFVLAQQDPTASCRYIPSHVLRVL
ncbi:MAG TPA: hypothetical protein VED87_04865 [Methylocystis sp.]|nr:hypothetical protein [Methylocystis sp.]